MSKPTEHTAKEDTTEDPGASPEQFDAPDEDDLEEFEEIGYTGQVADVEVKDWETFAQTTWDDEDTDDGFCAKLAEELRRFKEKQKQNNKA